MKKTHKAANGTAYQIERSGWSPDVSPKGQRVPWYTIRFVKTRPRPGEEREERWTLTAVGRVWREGTHWRFSQTRKPDAWQSHSSRREAIDALAEAVNGPSPKHDDPWVVWGREPAQ
jgi:hypothetical protein